MARRSESKIDPAPIIRAHYSTLRDATSGRIAWRDYAEQVAIPVAAGVTAWCFNVRISAATGVAILTLAGLFAAFLFQLIIQLLDRASGWADSSPGPGPDTSRHALLLSALSANAGYASLVAATTATASLAVVIASRGWPERVFAAATVALLAHLGATLLMVTRRVFLLTVSRLRDVRTGTNRKAA